MNHCKYCHNEIPEKTARGTPRTFCNKSCSRKHYCENNKEKLIEAGRKSFETIQKEKPEVLKIRGRSTEKKRNAMRTLNEQGHFSKMGKLGVQKCVENGNLFGGVEHTKRVMIDNGKWLDYEVFDFDKVSKYTRVVRKLTRDIYGSAGDGYHWDHVVPISKAFILGIPPEMLCRKENIMKMKSKENLSKGNKITKEAESILEDWGYSADDLF